MRGVFTALVTPFTKSGELDLKSYQSILEDQVSAGVAGVVVCGTTGESPTLSDEEKKTLILKTLSDLKGTSVKVVAGTGSNHTQRTIQFSQWASQQGVDGVLVVTPYYNKPSQIGLEHHFNQVASSVECEVILYHVPGRTGVSLTAETITRLAQHPKITTLKEASGNVAFTSEIINQLSLTGRQLDILSGDDATYLPLLSVGAHGVISVASNLFPRALVELQTAFDSSQTQRAMKIHQKYYALFRDLFVESNPVPIKEALNFHGLCGPQVRLPLVELTSANSARLRASLSECEIQPGKKL